jgi:hypothetical protein
MKPHDKQLRDILLVDVLEKRRLGQALNAKEFAVVAGVSYSTAREWFRLPGFPVFRGVVFWQDFEQWRRQQNGLSNTANERPTKPPQPAMNVSLPPRAAKILLAA